MRRLSDVELLERLVAFDTTSRLPSAPIFDFVADYLRSAGCRLQRWDSSGGKAELVAWRGPACEGIVERGLTLSGHLDCVPADEPGWDSDPFRLLNRGGRLTGRGAVDMKGFAAIAMNLLAEAPEDAGGPLALLLTSDEEVGSLGAQRFARTWHGTPALPGNVVIGEPTGLRVVRMHKGHLKLRIAVEGRASHSGLPEAGINAIERGAQVVTALAQVAGTLRAERCTFSRAFPECPYPVLNIGMIRGGRAVNVVPDECVIDLGLRLLPGQRSEDYGPEYLLRRLPAPLQDVVKCEIVNDSPPMLCPADAPVLQRLLELTGQTEELGVSFASDAGWLSRQGFACVLFGPGDMQDAHCPNESIALEQLEAASARLCELISRCR